MVNIPISQHSENQYPNIPTLGIPISQYPNIQPHGLKWLAVPVNSGQLCRSYLRKLRPTDARRHNGEEEEQKGADGGEEGSQGEAGYTLLSKILLCHNPFGLLLGPVCLPLGLCLRLCLSSLSLCSTLGFCPFPSAYLPPVTHTNTTFLPTLVAPLCRCPR